MHIHKNKQLYVMVLPSLTLHISNFSFLFCTLLHVFHLNKSDAPAKFSGDISHTWMLGGLSDLYMVFPLGVDYATAAFGTELLLLRSAPKKGLWQGMLFGLQKGF